MIAHVAGSACSAASPVEFIGKASIPATALDKSGLVSEIVDGLPHARLGSFGSAIDYTGKDDLYIAADDRGPKDGAAAFRPRVQTFRISIKPGAVTPVSVELVRTTLLSDEHGQPLWGYAAAFNADNQPKGARLDPEGLRITPRGTMLISEEYGPFVDEYRMDGTRVRRLVPPAKFLVKRPSDDPARELPPWNTSGRQPNRGFEGLAITPKGDRALAILQSPLIQDGALREGKRVGVNIRILSMAVDDAAPAPDGTREMVYQLDSPSHGVCELLAIDDSTFIVLERDGKAGSSAAFRRLFMIDTRDGSDVSGIEALPSEGLPASIRPVRKAPLLDFMDPSFGLAGEGMPEKIEGVCFGPALDDGRRTLIVTSDNDFLDANPSWFWVFALEAAALRMPAAPGANTGAGRTEHATP